MLPNHSAKGFTLIELLVVMAIIVILGISAYLAFTSSDEETYNNRVKADVQTIANVLRQYQKSDQFLPDPQGVVNFTTISGQYSHSASGAYIVQGFGLFPVLLRAI